MATLLPFVQRNWALTWPVFKGGQSEAKRMVLVRHELDVLVLGRGSL